MFLRDRHLLNERVTQLRRFAQATIALAATIALMPNPATAQSAGDTVEARVVPPTITPSAFSTTSWPGPVIYVADSVGRLGTVELGTGKVVPLGSLGVALTDITFCPNQKLYGVSFNTLYEITPSPLVNRRVGSFGELGINALACDRNNRLVAHSSTLSRLFRINPLTGAATLIGNTGVFLSAGDLVFHEKDLLLASTSNSLTVLNPARGTVKGNVYHGISNLFGLVSIGPNELIGCAGTTMYRINRATGATLALGNYISSGLGSCFGTAYNGNFR